MRSWLTSVAIAALALKLMDTSAALQKFRDQPLREAANVLDRAALLLQGTSPSRRDRLASIERIADFRPDEPLRRLAAGVGLLSVDYRNPEGKLVTSSCTAAVIAPTLLITARHCLFDGDREINASEIWFDHTAPGEADVYPVGPIVIANEALDFALLTMRLPADHPARTALQDLAIRAPIPGERALLIHHADGNVQQLSRAFCRVSIEQHDKSTVTHTCPSMPGASGAVLIAERDHALLGLHTKYSRTSPQTIGYASRLTEIAEKAGEALAAARPDTGRRVAGAP